MHHALEIQEILLNIFGHCYSPGRRRDLASLATTCRTFREPALDVLWEVLDDLSPLARCLPEASHQLSMAKYSFRRPLTQADWDILRSYTRRIRSMLDFRGGLDQQSFIALSNPLTTEPLFPNLRYLRCEFTTKCRHLLHLPLPSLISLDVDFEHPHSFQDFLESFPDFSRSIGRLFLYMGQPDIAFSNFFSNYICRWQNLQIVICPLIALDMNALLHLSRAPVLTRLSFSLDTTLPAFDSPLFFSTLHDMTIRSGSLGTISQLLSQIRLPVITDIIAFASSRPSKQDLCSFMSNIRICGIGHTIQGLRLAQSMLVRNGRKAEAPLLGLDDLRPCMAFSNLRRIDLNIEWNVGLTDSDLLKLASAWPNLEHLMINEYLGWNTRGGITPDALVQVFQTCRSLRGIAIAIDARGYTEIPPTSRALASVGLTSPATFRINVLDSIIEADSVPAIAACLASIAPCPNNFWLDAWNSWVMAEPLNMKVYIDRWRDVSRRVNGTLSQRC